MSNILLFGLGGQVLLFFTLVYLTSFFGRVGAVYAFVLQRAGARVTVVARGNYDQVANEGLIYESKKYGNMKNVKFFNAVKTASDPSICDEKFDYVVCTNKAISMSPTASELITPAVTERHTTIVVIQNGIGVGDEFKARFPNNVVLTGVTWVGVHQHVKGTIVHEQPDAMQLGVDWSDHIDKTTQQSMLDKFVNLLESAGSECTKVDQIEAWRWKKTMWNCCWNSTTALSLQSTSDFLGSSSYAAETALGIMKEMAKIAGALGHPIEDEYIENLLETPQLRNPGLTSSMMMDVKAGRPLEAEVILLKPLREAKRLGIETPILQTCCALVLAVDSRLDKERRLASAGRDTD